MTEKILDNETSEHVAEELPPATAKWPLAYRLQPAKPRPSLLQVYGYGLKKAPPRRWWSYQLYRGPGDKEVEILYSRTKSQSEIIAQHFVDEPIVGFDMEWPWNDWKKDDLQNKVGLIQIASEAKIGLFHIGLHPGKTTDDIIAPTLRKIIESPNIGKVGVAILKADFGRLSRYFGLKPKGAIESSHLYRLVKYGPYKPELVSVKAVSLANQVEDQLGLPLFKGEVRTSNWSKPLSKDQINYAASDAYAGFMLYHCMNTKRLRMDPLPGLPIYDENYPPGKKTKDDPILLDAGDGTTISTAVFFGINPRIVESSKGDDKAKKIAEAAIKDKARVPVLDQLSQALFDDLKARRAIIAERTRLQEYRVISDTLLAKLASKRPCDNASLISIQGIGKVQVEKYGSAWLEVISLFLTNNGLENTSTSGLLAVVDLTEDLKVPEQPKTPRRTRKKEQETPDSSPAFASPPPRTPQLHTGLSFILAETTLNNNKDAADLDNAVSVASDESLDSIDFGSPSQRQSSAQKRKRDESPVKNRTAPPHPRHDAYDFSATPLNVARYIYSPDSKTDVPANATPSKTLKPKSIKDIFTAPPNTAHSPPTQQSPQAIPAQSPPHTVPMIPPSPASRIARNKLLAFSRLVARKLPNYSPTAPPLLTDHTLDLIVRSAPTTQDELEKIPGVDGLLWACEKTETDCLRNIVKFVGKS